MGKSKKKTDGDKNGGRISKWKQAFNRSNSFYDEVSFVFRFRQRNVTTTDVSTYFRIRLRI